MTDLLVIGAGCLPVGQQITLSCWTQVRQRGVCATNSGHFYDAGDRFDILIAADVLAEGVNLQQCRNIINYDLPWNPMRLIQRMVGLTGF